MMIRLLAFWFLISASAFAQGTGACPEGLGAAKGDEPKLTVKTPAKWNILVCGNKENRLGSDVFSEFEVYASQGKKLNKLAFQATAVDTYAIKKTRTGAQLQELALMDNEWLPLFAREIRCAKGGCSLTRKHCANVKPKHKAKSAHSLLEYYRKDAKRNSSTGQATDESEIAIVLAAALSGEKEALEAFDKNPGFRLDGASAEQYEAGKRTLKQLKTMRCRY